MKSQLNDCPIFFVFFYVFILRKWWPVECGLSMWGKMIILMYRLCWHGLYGLYGPRCPLFPERPFNFNTRLLSHTCSSADPRDSAMTTNCQMQWPVKTWLDWMLCLHFQAKPEMWFSADVSESLERGLDCGCSPLITEMHTKWGITLQCVENETLV